MRSKITIALSLLALVSARSHSRRVGARFACTERRRRTGELAKMIEPARQYTWSIG